MKRQVIIASPLLAVSFVLGSCEPCSHGVQNEILSPSGKMVVTIYQADCGATTDFATGLSVRRAGERFRPSENIALGMAGQVPLSASWQSDSELTVAVPAQAEIRVKKEEMNGVTIHYQPSE